MSDAAESLALAVAAWRSYSAHLPGHQSLALPGLDVVWAGTGLSFYNAVFLAPAPLRSTQDFARDAAQATRFLRSRPEAGLFVICDQQLAGPAPEDFGFVPEFRLTGMVAEKLAEKLAEQLAPPRHALPALTFRRVDDDPTAQAMADINSRAYGTDLPAGRDVLAVPGFRRPDRFGFVAFSGSRPVSCAVVFPLNGCLYSALVATDPDLTGHGFAEAVLRHALAHAAAQTGLSRFALHATEAGKPTYLRMGFRETAHFTAFSPAPLPQPHRPQPDFPPAVPCGIVNA